MGPTYRKLQTQILRISTNTVYWQNYNDLMTLEYPKKQLICLTRRVNSYKKPTEIALANDIMWDAGNGKYQELHALFSTLSVCGHIPKALALLKDLVSEARIDVLATLQ